MDLCNSIEFIQVNQNQHTSFILALEIQMETRTFHRFTEPFVTGKYLSVMQWEEITRAIEKIAKNYMKSNIGTDGEFHTEEVIVNWKISPREQSWIRFKKLPFQYTLDWILEVKITKIAPLPDRPITPDVIDISVPKQDKVLEYEPNNVSEQIGRLKSKYKPGSIETSKEKKPPEYSPRPVSTDFASSKTYTPSKIEVDNEISSGTSQQSQKMYELFGPGSEDENKDSQAETISGSERSNAEKRNTKRRQLFTGEPKQDNSYQKRQKKPKVDAAQSNLNTWVERNATPTKITERKASKSKSTTKKRNGTNPLETFDEEQMGHMQNFIERTRQEEMEKVRRRDELEDFEVWDCNDLNNEELKRMITEFAPNIRNLYANHTAPPRNNNFSPVLITTSNILTEKQIDFVWKQIENQRDVNDRGSNEEIMMEKIIPEFIIYVFCSKFKLDRDEALERLKTQDERRSLFDDTQF